MIRNNGAQLLKDFTNRSYTERITQIIPGVWHVLGLGHSNAIFIEADSSVILVDTLDTLERGQTLLGIIEREIHKPVKTVIYTHGHPDHRGGAGAFSATSPEIIAFAPKNLPLEHTDWLQNIQNLRGNRQFGYNLTDEENISQGIGIREGITHGEQRAFVPPTTVYQEDRIIREIDGIRLELVRLPGESDDQIMVWLAEKEVLCCGDNFYGCWPNLYAIRGGQYRDIATWIRSLEAIMACRPRYLLPGHTAALAGEEIQTVLGNFKGAIESILTQTLRGMNEGKSIDTLATEIQLPPEYAGLPYLGEHYGSVDWTVRAIYTAYLGWFDGNPTRLHPLPPTAHAQKSVALMGGAQTVCRAANNALAAGEQQWCLELCDLLLACDEDSATCARNLKADALEQLAEYETSANGRHYYLACAHELRGHKG